MNSRTAYMPLFDKVVWLTIFSTVVKRDECKYNFPLILVIFKLAFQISDVCINNIFSGNCDLLFAYADYKFNWVL